MGGKTMKEEGHNEIGDASTRNELNRRLSRRKFFKISLTGVAIAGAGGLASCATGPRGTRGGGITPKFLAAYQNSPNRGRRCAECTHFLEPDACEIVAGEISPNGWCRYYKAQAA
jgi:hypothetical protein